MTPTPGYVCDSIDRTLLTADEIVYSEKVVIRRHVLGGQTVVVPDHRDHRDVDLGKDVRRRGDDRGDAEQHDGEPHHDEGVGTAKRQPNDPHVAGLPPCSVDADESDGDSWDRARVLALMLRKRAARDGFLSGVHGLT